MEVFKVWLGDYGLVVKQDCPYFPSEDLRFSVTKIQRESESWNMNEELVECCLEKDEAKTLVGAAISDSNLDNDDLIINVAKGFNW